MVHLPSPTEDGLLADDAHGQCAVLELRLDAHLLQLLLKHDARERQRHRERRHRRLSIAQACQGFQGLIPDGWQLAMIQECLRQQPASAGASVRLPGSLWAGHPCQSTLSLL